MKKFTRFLVLKGLQPITVKGHTDGTERILKKIGSYNPTHDEASEYVAALYTSSYSYSYKVNQATSLEYWLEYLGNPIKFGRQRKPKRLLKETLTEAEVIRLILASQSSKERAIITLLAYSGLRPKEICRVKVGEISFGLNTLRVEQGKGAKDGLVYLSGKCIEALMNYLQETPRPLDDTLFETYQHRPYNQQALRKLMKVMARRAGIEKRVYPYLLRHSLATHMVLRGANLLHVRDHFRHAWLSTTELYVHSIGLQERSEQYFPQYV